MKMRKYLVERRNQLELSQQDVADLIGVSRQYYSFIENGSRQKKMDIDLLSKLADALSIPIADLIEMERRNTDAEGNDACGDGECIPGAVPEVRRPAV